MDSPVEVNTTVIFLKMLAALGVIIFLMLMLLYSLKLVNKKFQPFRDDLIKIISSKYIHPKKQLTLIKISDSYLLIGSTESHITLLHKFEEKDFDRILMEKEVKIENEIKKD